MTLRVMEGVAIQLKESFLIPLTPDSLKKSKQPMRHFLRVLSLGLCLLSFRAFGSAELDKTYAVRTIVPVILNVEQDPVYGEHVEGELIKYFKTHSRFDVNQQAYEKFRDAIRPLYLVDPSVPMADKLTWVKPQLEELAKQEVDAALVGEILLLADGYRLSFALISLRDFDYVLTKEAIVEDRYSLQSFSSATVSALNEIAKLIPFDGTVIRRDGYRVVLDRGGLDLAVGQEMPIYTLEKRDEKLALEETGFIQITEVGDMISFGNILVEKRPAEIATGNKILIVPPEVKRELSSVLGENKEINRQLGWVSLALGANFVNMNNLGANGTGATSGNTTFPGAGATGEIWLTNRTFAQLGLDYSFATITANDVSLNSSATDIRIQVGYRMDLGRAKDAPQLNFRVGYGRHSMSVDAADPSLPFTSATYSGILLGGGMGFTITEEYQVGFNMIAMAMPSVSESPFKSGAETTSVGGYEFSLYAIRHLTPKLDLLTRLQFQSFNAEFSGQGTRPTPVVSISQTSKALLVGAVYYF